MVGEIAVAAVRVQDGLPLTKRTGSLDVGVGSVLGVLAGLFGGPDELHLSGAFLGGAVVGIAVERVGDPIIAGIPAGEAGGGRGVGELRLDRAPLFGPLAEQPFGVLDIGEGAGEPPEPAGASLDGAGGFGGDGPVGVPAGPQRGLDLLGSLLEQAPRHSSLLFGGIGRGAGGGGLLAQRSQDAFVLFASGGVVLGASEAWFEPGELLARAGLLGPGAA